MNVNSLYRLASSLDTEGKYLEADVVLDSMMRFAKGAEKYHGNRAKRPKIPFSAMPGARPAVPVTPVTPVTPVAQVPKPPSSAYNPDPFGNYSIRDTLGYTDPGPAQRQPANIQTPRTQTPGTRPYNLGQMNNDVRMRVWKNRSLNPRLYDLLELEHSAGRFNPKTGELVESAVETLGRVFEKGGPTVVQQGGKAGRGGAAAAAAAKASQFATKAANNPATANIISALTKVSSSLSAIKPLLKILPFLGFAASIPEMINLVNKINQKGWKSIWDDPYDRAKAIGVLANTVSAAVSLAPGPLTPVALALSAIGIGSDLGADVARDAGDAAEGGEFKLFGKTLKQKSQQRQQQDALEAGLNAKNIDPQVQSALDASKRMFMAGSKSIDIMNDQKMKFIYRWLGTGDALDTQYKFLLPKLRQSLRSGGAQPQAAQQGQPQQQGQGPYLNKPPYSGPVNQQVQPAYNNSQQRQQQMPPLNNHNDLLYKAYVDTTQTSNVTLENLKNYRQQIITKIQALAQYYPNINAQQAITALDNRIRKYSGQAQAQPA